jgi:hypothetical protein
MSLTIDPRHRFVRRSHRSRRVAKCRLLTSIDIHAFGYLGALNEQGWPFAD